MNLERQKFLADCKRVLCHKLSCSSCVLENFCYYEEDVNVEHYVPNIEQLISQANERSAAMKQLQMLKVNRKGRRSAHVKRHRSSPRRNAVRVNFR